MSARQRVESCCPSRRRSVPGNSYTYFSKPDSRDPGDQWSRRGPDTKCRNSLAPMPYAVGRDLQVSDVLLTGGSRRHWQDRGLDPRRLMRTKSHTLPVSGGAALTSFDVGSKRHRIGRRDAHRRSVSFLRLQRRVCLCPKRPKRTGNYCRRPRLTDPEEPPLLGYRTMRRPNRTAAYQVGPSSHRSPHGDCRRRPPPPREAAGTRRWLEKLPSVSSVHSFEDQCALERVR